MDQETLESYETLEDIDRILNLIFPLILIPIGTIANMITFYIYCQKPFKNTSIGFYYSCLAIIDSLALCIGSIKFYLIAIDLISVINISEFGCKMFITTLYILSEYSAWILVITSFDRLVSILNYHALMFVKTKYFRLVSIFSLFFIIFLINSPSFFYLKIAVEEINVSNQSTEIFYTCDLEPHGFYNNKLRDILDLFLFALLPFFFMTLSNGLISYNLIKSKKKFKKNISIKRKNTKKEYHLAITIIGTNFVFLILNLPICIVQIIRNFCENELNYPFRMNSAFAYTIANILSYINLSSSLFINLVFNHIFKKRFLKMMRSIFLLKNNHKS